MKNLLYCRSFAHSHSCSPRSFLSFFSTIYIYDFLALRKFYEFPMPSKPWGGMGKREDQMHDKKRECRNKFHHKLNVPHNVATCEHKSDRDEKEM
jgi:hypothetical protein